MTDDQAHTLVGRDHDLDQLVQASAAHRLVTVHGAGGIGKTSLCRAFCARHPAALFVPLVGAHSTSEVLAQAATALGLRIGQLGPTDEAASARLAAAIGGRGDVVLVLDNAEHVKAPLAALLPRLLEAAPRVRVVVTSRDELGLLGEHTHELTALSAADAAALFVARARQANPQVDLDDAEQLAQVLTVLAGVPLAIELAAARTEVLSLSQLAERLKRPLALLRSQDATFEPRHRALIDTIQWSWDLLSADDQRGLAWLARLRGGFTSDEVAGLLPAELDPRARLQSLVQKSLVAPAGRDGRHSLLPVMRSFLATRSADLIDAARADAEFTRTFLDWFDDLDPRDDADVAWAAAHVDDVTEAMAHRAAQAPAEMVDRLPRFDLLFGPYLPVDRFIGLFDRALAADVEPGLEAALRVSRGEAWLARQRHAEAGEDADAALALLASRPGADAERWRGRAHSLRGSGLTWVGRFDDARAAFAAAAPLLARSPFDRARLLWRQFSAAINEGDLEAAGAQADEVRAAAQAFANPRDEVFVLINLAWLHFERGDTEQARAELWQAEPGAAHFTSEDVQILIRFNLGFIELEHEELVAAFTQASETLERAERSGSRLMTGMGALLLGLVLAEQGDDDAAELWLAQADRTMSATDHARRARLCPSGYRACALARLGRREAALAVVQELAARAPPPTQFAPAQAYLLPAARWLLEAPAPGDAVPDEVAAALALPAVGATRLARRWLERALRPPAPPPVDEEAPVLRVAADQRRFALGAHEVDLSRRGPARRTFQALLAQHRAEPDAPLSSDMLFAAAWPGQTVGPQSARNRVYAAVRELRRLGLGPWLLTAEGGYLLSSALTVAQEP